MHSNISNVIYRVGLIRVMTLDDPKAIQVQGRLIQSLYPSLEILSRCIPDQYEGIFDDQTLAAATPKIIQLGRKLMQEGLDALIVSCAADPAVAELRQEAALPVIGAGSAVAYATLSMGRRIGVLGIGAGVPAAIEAILGKQCTGYRRVPEVQNASEISTRTLSGALEQVGALVAQGADTILLACAGLAAIGLARQVHERFGVISFDPVHAAGALTHHILSVTKRRIISDG